MSVPIVTITHPDGSVSTRQSKHPYLFGVVVELLDPARHRAYLLLEIEKDADQQARLEAGLVDPQFSIQQRVRTSPGVDPDIGLFGIRGYNNFSGSLRVESGGNTFVSWPCDSTGAVRIGFGPDTEPVADVLVRRATEWAAGLAAKNSARRATIAEIDEGIFDPGPYDVRRWSTREKLAVAALGRFGGYTRIGHSITIVPVDAS
jgi:hypothetical protein